MFRKPLFNVFVAFCGLATSVCAEYPVQRPERTNAVSTESGFGIFPDLPKQVIKGIGFEIQSDSIASGNLGLPETATSVPHDLVPAERNRFYTEMLKGFRYCRLAGGLYWRGLDADQKYMQGRWPEQMGELREMLSVAGIEGVSLEYWSPAPFWKANRKFTGSRDHTSLDASENVLRCFGKNFANDPEYRGDKDRFLNDFAAACRRDLETLRANGIRVSKWGLQNEPSENCPYSSCIYTPANYAQTFLAVAPVVRAFDPQIEIISDTAFGQFARAVLERPGGTNLMDALVIHHVGSDANDVLAIPRENTGKPRFQNEYEYLNGPTSPARCLNTVQHIMNWFQVGEAPTWFWIHALKPVGNIEASGYSLGFWRPIADTNAADNPMFPGLKPGCWTWNKYNWHAVGSFVRHMPWDCRAVTVTEESRDNDLRILAFKKPDGKLVVVLSNRSFHEHTFHIATGLSGATFKGWRYSPDEAGGDFMGVELGPMKGGTISPKLDDLTWEFWEEQ